MDYAIVAWFVLGVLLRIFVPYLVEWLNDQRPFEWKYLTGQLLGAMFGLAAVFVDDTFVDALQGYSLLAIIATGYMFADLGRAGKKLTE